MTKVAINANFVCDLLSIGGREQAVKGRTTIAMCGIPCSNDYGIHAIICLQWHNCDDNFSLIEIFSLLWWVRYHMKAFKISRLMIKTTCKSDED